MKERVRSRASEIVADRGLLAVALGACAAGIVFALYGIARHRAYRSAAMDFAFFDQVVWNTSRGRWFETSFVPYNFLGQHVEPILLLFAALYRITPAPEWLLVTQGVAAGGAAIPLYLLGRMRLVRPWLAALVAAAYLVSPALHRAVAFDYHSEVMAGLFVFSGLALLHGGHTRAGALALFGTLLLKEDAALALVGLALPLWLWGFRRAALVSGAAGVAWVVLVVGLLMPAVRGGESDLEARYAHLGTGAGGIASGIARDPLGATTYALGPRQRDAVVRQLASLGGLPLLAPLTLAGAAPVAALQLLSSHDRQQSLDLQYGAQVLPILFVATIEGLRRLERSSAGESRRALPPRWRRICLAELAALSLVLGSLWGSYDAGRLPPAWRSDDSSVTHAAQAGAIERAIGVIPGDASLSAQSGLAAHVSQRRRVWEFPVLGGAEYVLLDLDGMVARPYQEVYDAEVAALPQRGYVLVWSEGSVRVYHKREGVP